VGKKTEQYYMRKEIERLRRARGRRRLSVQPTKIVNIKPRISKHMKELMTWLSEHGAGRLDDFAKAKSYWDVYASPSELVEKLDLAPYYEGWKTAGVHRSFQRLANRLEKRGLIVGRSWFQGVNWELSEEGKNLVKSWKETKSRMSIS
jgi:hypothetical protein